MRDKAHRWLDRLTLLHAYSTLLYSTLLYITLHYSTLHYSTLLYSTLLHSTLLYSTLLYSTLLYCTCQHRDFHLQLLQLSDCLHRLATYLDEQYRRLSEQKKERRKEDGIINQHPSHMKLLKLPYLLETASASSYHQLPPAGTHCFL